MNAVAPRRDVEKALEVIKKFVPTDPTAEPVEFVRELARRWKDKGGLLAGKHRHSDRYLDDLLRLQGTPIRSLTPKLVGRTNLRQVDADVLVRLFLSHWNYIGDPDSRKITVPSSDQYEPMLSDAEIAEVSEYIAELITASETETVPAAASLPLGQNTTELIANEFRNAAAIFIAAIGSPVVVPILEETLVGFITVMHKLWEVERADSRGRILVWTMDLGRQVLDDPESVQRFMNVQALITRFKALKLFKQSVPEALLNWLRSQAIIVLHDTRSVLPDVPRLPAFDPHHVLFSAIPPKWAGSSQFIDLYGTKPAQANYTIFLRPLERFPERTKRSDQSSVTGQLYTLRYFGHALKPNENGEPDLRGLRLDAPGQSYVEALGTVFIAANQELGLPSMPAELVIDGMKMEIDPAHAIEKLRHHGFRLLRLDEFIEV
jgi:hypothetical protein